MFNRIEVVDKSLALTIREEKSSPLKSESLSGVVIFRSSGKASVGYSPIIRLTVKIENNSSERAEKTLNIARNTLGLSRKIGHGNEEIRPLTDPEL